MILFLLLNALETIHVRHRDQGPQILKIQDPVVARVMVEPIAKVGADTQMGLGWMLSAFPGLGTVAWHTGGTFGQHAIIGWTLEDKRAVVILTNGRPPLWHNFVGSRSLEKLAENVVAMQMQGAV